PDDERRVRDAPELLVAQDLALTADPAEEAVGADHPDRVAGLRRAQEIFDERRLDRWIDRAPVGDEEFTEEPGRRAAAGAEEPACDRPGAGDADDGGDLG